MQENSSDADLQHYGKSCFEISPHVGDGKTNVKESLTLVLPSPP